jgi:hypothetical protein
MAHLPRYYHKAAALLAVHQSYEPVFVFSILRSKWTGHHHAGEDFVKFGDRSDKQIENSGNPSTYWRQGRTDCLELGSPRKNSSKTCEFSGFFRNFCSGVFIVFFVFVAEWRIFGKKKTHCYERLVSIWNTSVKSLRIDPTLLLPRLGVCTRTPIF